MAEDNDEIYSLLVPLMEQRLLIPRSNVVEVAALSTLGEYTGGLPWLLGTMEWEGTLIPVVSFEGVCGDEVPPISRRARVVLFRCLTGALDGRAFGVVSQGFPQLVRVGVDALTLEEDLSEGAAPIICKVAMGNQYPLVPDIERLEQLIADAISVSH